MAGAAALLVCAIFLSGLAAMLTSLAGSPAKSGWFAWLQNNWLVVLFRLNIETSGVGAELLNQINLLDIFLFILIGAVFLDLHAALRGTSKIWSMVAACLPFLGLVVFLITATAGRSGLLVGGLIFSIVMLRSQIFSKASASVGIAASILLFIGGDLGTAFLFTSTIIAVLIGVGYLLWIVWFFLLASRFFQLAGSAALGSPQ
jgi:hypothetical protein